MCKCVCVCVCMKICMCVCLSLFWSVFRVADHGCHWTFFPCLMRVEYVVKSAQICTFDRYIDYAKQIVFEILSKTNDSYCHELTSEKDSSDSPTHLNVKLTLVVAK